LQKKVASTTLGEKIRWQKIRSSKNHHDSGCKNNGKVNSYLKLTLLIAHWSRNIFTLITRIYEVEFQQIKIG
jgi:hypothetical protein